MKKTTMHIAKFNNRERKTLSPQETIMTLGKSIFYIFTFTTFIMITLLPQHVRADQSSEIAELKQLILELQKKQAKEISALKAEIEQLKSTNGHPQPNQTLTKIKQDIEELQEDKFTESESLMEKIQLHGTMSQGYLQSDTDYLMVKNPKGKYDNSSFHYNEFAVNVSANLTDKLHAGLQLMSRDYLTLMNNKIYLDWAVIDYSWKDEMGLRAGRLKIPFGFYNESRDIDIARTSIFLPNSVYSEIRRSYYNFSDGFGMYGSLDINKMGTLSYQTVWGDADLEREGINDSKGETDFEVQAEDIFSFQLTWDTPIEGLKLGGTYLQADAEVTGSYDLAYDYPGMGLSTHNPWTRDYDKHNVWIGSAEYTWNNLIMAAEYQETRFDIHDSIFNIATQGYILQDYDNHNGGWYLSLSYQFTDWLSTEVYYSEYYANMDDKDGDTFAVDYYAWQKDWSVNTMFTVNDHWIIKAGITFKDGMADTDEIDATEVDTKQHWLLYQFKTTVYF